MSRESVARSNPVRSASAAALPAVKKQQRVEALFDCQGDNADELNFTAGDIILVLDKPFDDWWMGEHTVTKERGILPANFVKEIAVRVQALHDFEAQSPDELAFPAGAVIEITSQEHPEWWVGLYNGKKGMFPASWVTVFEEKVGTSIAERARLVSVQLSKQPSQQVLGRKDSPTPASSSSTPTPASGASTSAATSSSSSSTAAVPAPPKKPSKTLFSRLTKDKNKTSKKDRKSASKDTFQDLTTQDQLIRIVTSPDLALVTAVLQLSDMREKDRVATCLVHLFEINGTTPHLVRTLIRQEIDEIAPESSSASALFRGNSVATKVLTAYALIAGADYLRRTLRPLIQSVVYSSEGFEIDPMRLTPTENIRDNIQNLQAASTMFINKIFRSADSVPVPLRMELADLSSAVREKFPDAELPVLGSFFFLRFICPSIVSPSESGVWTEKLPDNSRRCLLLISKILQNLANGILFGSKEPFMEPLNPFIQEHMSGIKQFFAQVSCIEPGSTEGFLTNAHTVLKRDPELFLSLHDILAQRIESIRSHVERTSFGHLDKVELLEQYLRET